AGGGEGGGGRAGVDDGRGRLDGGEPGPRRGPSLRGFRPQFQRILRLPRHGPDPVTMPPTAELVVRAPVPDGHIVLHGTPPSRCCSAPGLSASRSAPP